MNESIKKTSEKSGRAPGSLVYVGNDVKSETSLSIVKYSYETVEEKDIHTADEILKYQDNDSITMVLVEGLTDISIIESIGEIFGINHLVIEDILNTNQRPKLEEYEEYLYIVAQCLTPEDNDLSVLREQISIILADKIVLVFKEKKDDFFNPILKRIRNNKSRLRKSGSDYLVYVILDILVDKNFTLIDSLEEYIELVEDRLTNFKPEENTLSIIQNLRRETVKIKRHIYPIEDMINKMIHCEYSSLNEETVIYLRDVHDHAVRINELIEYFRELQSGSLQIYMSLVSNKMNEVMKILTIFASIFIPLTFLAGIYGMNFEYMPELKWRWAYPCLWIVFISIFILLVFYFKRKKWF